MKVKEFEMLVRKHAGKQAPSFLKKLRKLLKEEGRTLNQALKIIDEEFCPLVGYGIIGGYIHHRKFISYKNWMTLLKPKPGQMPDKVEWHFLYDPAVKL